MNEVRRMDKRHKLSSVTSFQKPHLRRIVCPKLGFNSFGNNPPSTLSKGPSSFSETQDTNDIEIPQKIDDHISKLLESPVVHEPSLIPHPSPSVSTTPLLSSLLLFHSPFSDSIARLRKIGVTPKRDAVEFPKPNLTTEFSSFENTQDSSSNSVENAVKQPLPLPKKFSQNKVAVRNASGTSWENLKINYHIYNSADFKQLANVSHQNQQLPYLFCQGKYY